ncbi:hypothetical protein Moror_15843 [Moniliophthora roreri MCA 2997]|uniref:Uncharacterized protein n=1 Tax=Moniliophthora roreri (strain MCA 2997) TaxID=1381753 RepID=V2XQI4_MONRO|nr:hypothetical protein Moror_15843 [Moniliophthora roreri MCA 2997]
MVTSKIEGCTSVQNMRLRCAQRNIISLYSVALLFATNLATMGGHVAEMISIFVYPVIGYFWIRRTRRSPSVDLNIAESPRSMILVENMTNSIDALAKCIANLVSVVQTLERASLQRGVLTLMKKLSDKDTRPDDVIPCHAASEISQNTRLLQLKAKMPLVSSTRSIWISSSFTQSVGVRGGHGTVGFRGCQRDGSELDSTKPKGSGTLHSIRISKKRIVVDTAMVAIGRIGLVSEHDESIPRCLPRPYLAVHCYVKISHHVEVDSLQHFTLPQLRRLDISGSYQSIVAIMHRLCLPSLQRLDVDTDEQIGAVADQLLSSVARLQLRSSCNLYSLAAPFTLFSSPNSPSLAEKLGTVQDVRLLSTEEDNVRAISNFLHSTMFRDLNTLHLLFRELPDKDPALFLDMVQVVTARSHQQPLPYGASRLERLALDVIRPWVLPQIHISAQLEPFQRILRLQSDGLVLLGKVVDGKWFSFFGDAHWSDEDLRMSARRWARFGYSDWLHRSEVWRNHLLEVDAS